jgi:hypothetical protein
MNNKKSPYGTAKESFEYFEELQKKSVLVHIDRGGTKYYMPKVWFKGHDAERKRKVELAKDYHKREMFRLWKQICFNVGMLLDDIRWFIEIKVKG